MNEDAARSELFQKPGRVNIEERRRQRAAQRNPAYRLGEGLAGARTSGFWGSISMTLGWAAWASRCSPQGCWSHAAYPEAARSGCITAAGACYCVRCKELAGSRVMEGNGLQHAGHAAVAGALGQHGEVCSVWPAHVTEEDREEIHVETEKQEEAFDHIGAALGDLKRMGHVRPAARLNLCDG